jgi:hypothetical protein
VHELPTTGEDSLEETYQQTKGPLPNHELCGDNIAPSCVSTFNPTNSISSLISVCLNNNIATQKH